MLVMSVFAPFAGGFIGTASAASSDIALVAPSTDGSQVVFMDEDGNEIKTEPNPLSEPIDSIDVADGEFVISYYNLTDDTAEVGVYNFDMNQQWFDGNPSVDTVNNYRGNVHITEDASNALWNIDGATTIYDGNGNVVEEFTVKAWCPECSWTAAATKTGPAHPVHLPGKTAALDDVEDRVRRHCGEQEAFNTELHHPIVFTEDGAKRFEPEVGDSGEFVT